MNNYALTWLCICISFARCKILTQEDYTLYFDEYNFDWGNSQQWHIISLNNTQKPSEIVACTIDVIHLKQSKINLCVHSKSDGGFTVTFKNPQTDWKNVLKSHDIFTTQLDFLNDNHWSEVNAIWNVPNQTNKPNNRRLLRHRHRRRKRLKKRNKKRHKQRQRQRQNVYNSGHSSGYGDVYPGMMGGMGGMGGMGSMGGMGMSRMGMGGMGGMGGGMSTGSKKNMRKMNKMMMQMMYMRMMMKMMNYVLPKKKNKKYAYRGPSAFNKRRLLDNNYNCALTCHPMSVCHCHLLSLNGLHHLPMPCTHCTMGSRFKLKPMYVGKPGTMNVMSHEMNTAIKKCQPLKDGLEICVMYNAIRHTLNINVQCKNHKQLKSGGKKRLFPKTFSKMVQMAVKQRIFGSTHATNNVAGVEYYNTYIRNSLYDVSDDVVQFDTMEGNIGYSIWRAERMDWHNFDTIQNSNHNQLMDYGEYTTFGDFTHYFDTFEYNWNNIIPMTQTCGDTLPFLNFQLCFYIHDTNDKDITVFFNQTKAEFTDHDRNVQNYNGYFDTDLYELNDVKTLQDVIHYEFENSVFSFNNDNDWHAIITSYAVTKKCYFMYIAKVCVEADRDGQRLKLSIQFQNVRTWKGVVNDRYDYNKYNVVWSEFNNYQNSMDEKWEDKASVG